MNEIHIGEKEGLELIERYIFEKRGVRIKANRPNSIFRIQMYEQFVWIAFEYFNNKENGRG